MPVRLEQACQNGKQGRHWSGCFFRSSLVWVCAVCLGLFDRQLVFEILEHLSYFKLFMFWTYLRKSCAVLNLLEKELCCFEHTWERAVLFWTYLRKSCAVLNLLEKELCCFELTWERAVLFWTYLRKSCAVLNLLEKELCCFELTWERAVLFWTYLRKSCAALNLLEKELCCFELTWERAVLLWTYLRKSCDLASIKSPLSLSSGCRGSPANKAATASILAWSKSLQ